MSMGPEGLLDLLALKDNYGSVSSRPQNAVDSAQQGRAGGWRSHLGISWRGREDFCFILKSKH